ncbi:transcription factor GTE8-like protein [Corchorus olitorius]|uniref:Transcription factor GTE8-like protein n=1 Tax=Corchorus olitorius TaxID=93759 RepID=A0A1R3J2A7_9ROSI|nr:transcription factor GTE8-like protein [Corchorus olitorius]
MPPPPKERRPSIPVRYGYINRAAPSREQVSQPMAPRPVALIGSMSRRKLDLTEDMSMKVPNRSVTWKTVQRKLDFSSEDAKPSMMITSTVQGTSKPMMTRSKITALAPHNAAMEEEVTALATSLDLEKCNFKKDAEEVVPEKMFKVTDDMTFEYLVG